MKINVDVWLKPPTESGPYLAGASIDGGWPERWVAGMIDWPTGASHEKDCPRRKRGGGDVICTCCADMRLRWWSDEHAGGTPVVDVYANEFDVFLGPLRPEQEDKK